MTKDELKKVAEAVKLPQIDNEFWGEIRFSGGGEPFEFADGRIMLVLIADHDPGGSLSIPYYEINVSPHELEVSDPKHFEERFVLEGHNFLIRLRSNTADIAGKIPVEPKPKETA